MRKHKHEPRFTKKSGDWYDSNGNLMPAPLRRYHGIFTHVALDAQATAKATSRRLVYMHAHARRAALARGESAS